MVLDLLSSSICYLGSGVGQGRPGMGTGFGFFQSLGRLEPDKRWVSMVDWDCYRGGFGGGWAVSWFVNAMQGHCNVNPIFCLLGDFVLLLISSFEFVGMGDNMTRKKKL